MAYCQTMYEIAWVAPAHDGQMAVPEHPGGPLARAAMRSELLLRPLSMHNGRACSMRVRGIGWPSEKRVCFTWPHLYVMLCELPTGSTRQARQPWRSVSRHAARLLGAGPPGCMAPDMRED